MWKDALTGVWKMWTESAAKMGEDISLVYQECRNISE